MIRMRVLGVHCSAKDAYLTVVDDGTVVDGLPERLRLPSGIESGERLLEFLEEVRRTLGEVCPAHVVILQPEGKQRGASYVRIAPRVVLETLIRVCSAQENIPLDLQPRPTVRSRLGLPAKGPLDSHLDHAGPTIGQYWGAGRGLAALAAMSHEES